MPAMNAPAPAVAEIQGLYGPFSFPEKLLQKIWLRGDFSRVNARTTDGRSIGIGHPGKWNLLGGPDFRGARLTIGEGELITGDVELHLRAADWVAHGHAADRAYDGVVLHVVLFPPEPGHVTRGGDGRAIPVLALLPLLFHDLEEFAAEEAVAMLAGRAAGRVPEELLALDEAALAKVLAEHATSRWQQKVHFARLCITRLGWEAACHHAALEVLGYRFNRAPMLHVAARWPLAEWGKGAVDTGGVFADQAHAWSLQGVRPANHPRTRLAQYAVWSAARPDWPGRLAAMAKGDHTIPGRELPVGTREARRVGKFTALRAQVGFEICADALGGARLDTLICDGFLPLWAAREEEVAAESVHRWRWQHWFPGDLPPFVSRSLREIGVFGGAAQPACHGAAQGLLGWWLTRENRG
jgi:hypothetical protein